MTLSNTSTSILHQKNNCMNINTSDKQPYTMKLFIQYGRQMIGVVWKLLDSLLPQFMVCSAQQKHTAAI